MHMQTQLHPQPHPNPHLHPRPHPHPHPHTHTHTHTPTPTPTPTSTLTRTRTRRSSREKGQYALAPSLPAHQHVTASLTVSLATTPAPRRLVVGYVTSEWGDNSVGKEMQAVLVSHDLRRIVPRCYALSPRMPPSPSSALWRRKVVLCGSVDRMYLFILLYIISTTHVDIMYLFIIFMYTYKLYVYICIYVYMCIYVCVCTHSCIYIYIHVYTYT